MLPPEGIAAATHMLLETVSINCSWKKKLYRTNRSIHLFMQLGEANMPPVSAGAWDPFPAPWRYPSCPPAHIYDVKVNRIRYWSGWLMRLGIAVAVQMCDAWIHLDCLILVWLRVHLNKTWNAIIIHKYKIYGMHPLVYYEKSLDHPGSQCSKQNKSVMVEINRRDR